MMVTTLITLGGIILALQLIWWLWFRFSRVCIRLNRLPGPPTLPYLGNIHQVLGGCDVILQVMHVEWPLKYGEMYRVYLPPTYGPVISSPELIEAVVNNPELLDKGSDYEFLHPWLGLGLLTSSGAKWKSRRRLLTPAFHFHIMEDFFDTFNEQSSILCLKMDNLCRGGKAEVNLEQLTSLCTLDIICETAMGCKVDAQTKESEYVKAVHRMSSILIQQSLNPWGRVDFIFRQTREGKEYRKCLKILLDFTDRVISQRKSEFFLERNEPEAVDVEIIRKRRPFLDILLEASVNGAMLSDEDIREEVNTFMFEGHDTTAVTMNWFLHLMAANPHCQERLSEELFQVFGDSDRPCTRQDLSDLKYLECCIKETLRLHPTVPVFVRTVAADVQIGGFEIPRGADISVSIYALHRNPRIFPNPLVFDPDRFSPENSVGRHPYAFIPFSAGPRNCIGQRFAMAEEKVVLSSLLRRFKFALSPTAPKPNPSLELTLKSTTGIHVVVSPRQR